jgi:hypothetical protein
MGFIEIKAAHSDGVVDSQIGQHVGTAVCCDPRFNGSPIGEREIAQYVLSTRRISEETKGFPMGTDCRPHLLK